MNSKYLRIGRIVRPHGVRGDVKLIPATDDLERFSGLTDAYLETNGVYQAVRLSDVRLMPAAVALHVEGVDSVEAAERIKNLFLCVDRGHAAALPENTWFVADLIGCEVYDTDGTRYGAVTNVLETGANDVYEIDGGKLLVPALKKVLAEVDTQGGRIVFFTDVLREVGLFAD